MEPINKNRSVCSMTSSNSIVWQGRDLKCIGLCNGDTISDVVYKLATKLCEALETFDLSNYDLENIMQGKCGPKDFIQLIQELIDREYTYEGTANTNVNSKITLADCFRYTDEATGNIVTKLRIDEYIQKIAKKICELNSKESTQDKSIMDLNTRVKDLEINSKEGYEPKQVYSSLMDQYGIVDNFYAELDKEFTELKNQFGLLSYATSNSFTWIQQTKDTDKKYGDLAAWKKDVATISEEIANLKLVLGDLHDSLLNYMSANPLNPTIEIKSANIDNSQSVKKVVVNLNMMSVFNITDINTTIDVSTNNEFTIKDSFSIDNVLQYADKPCVLSQFTNIDINNVTGSLFLRITSNNNIKGNTFILDASQSLFGIVTQSDETDYGTIVFNVYGMKNNGMINLYSKTNSDTMYKQKQLVVADNQTVVFDGLDLFSEWYYNVTVGSNSTEKLLVSTKMYTGTAQLMNDGDFEILNKKQYIAECDLEEYLNNIN